MRASSRFALAVVVVSLGFAPLHASGAPLVIHASGVWDEFAPDSDWTVPGSTWSFSFMLDDHPLLEGAWDTGFNPVFHSFEYRLGGVVVPVSPLIALHSISALSLRFTNQTGFELFGPSLFSGPTNAPAINPGAYVLAAQPNTADPYFELDYDVYRAGLSGTILYVDALAVPEPAAIALLAVATAGVVRRRHRQTRR
jgi:hypothetical protein